MASEKTTSPRSDPLQSRKKKYASPQLAVYGGIIALTSAVGNMGNTDGGMGSTSKTH